MENIIFTQNLNCAENQKMYYTSPYDLFVELCCEGNIPVGDVPMKGLAASGLPPYLRHGLTPIHVAVHEGQQDVVSWLLARNADPRREDYRGCPPLHKAAERGSPDPDLSRDDRRPCEPREGPYGPFWPVWACMGPARPGFFLIGDTLIENEIVFEVCIC